jgi:hypothetical protein
LAKTALFNGADNCRSHAVALYLSEWDHPAALAEAAVGVLPSDRGRSVATRKASGLSGGMTPLNMLSSWMSAVLRKPSGVILESWRRMWRAESTIRVVCIRSLKMPTGQS